MAPAPKKDVSVFDFLYVDAQRISVFLAQFDEYGHLTGLTKTVSTGSNTGGTWNAQIAKRDFSDSAQSSVQKQYDQRWMAPLTFLDKTQSMMKRDLATARIGDLALTSGDLSLFDMSLLEKAWKLDFVKKAIVSTMGEQTQSIIQGRNRSERRRAGKPQEASSAQKDAEAGLEFMGILPHLIQATVFDQNDAVWCILRQEGLTTPANEIFLKHGVSVSGTWNIVGIIDALPDDDIDEVAALQQLVAANKLGGMSAAFASHMVMPVKLMLGRPKESFGITPILIFREIGA
jgi:hypothetical protein